MNCIYCGKKLEESTEYAFKVDEVSPCCSENCVKKANRYLQRPLQLRYFHILLISIGLGVLTALVDIYLVEIPFKNNLSGIVIGFLFVLASYISKPIGYTSIKLSVFIPRIFGLVILIYTLLYIFLTR